MNMVFIPTVVKRMPIGLRLVLIVGLVAAPFAALIHLVRPTASAGDVGTVLAVPIVFVYIVARLIHALGLGSADRDHGTAHSNHSQIGQSHKKKHQDAQMITGVGAVVAVAVAVSLLLALLLIGSAILYYGLGLDWAFRLALYAGSALGALAGILTMVYSWVRTIARLWSRRGLYVAWLEVQLEKLAFIPANLKHS